MDKNHPSLSTGSSQEVGNLQEQIRLFANSLELYGNSAEPHSVEETIETLRGISLGAFSCAELLTTALKKSNLSCQAVPQRKKTRQGQIKEKVGEILHQCADLSASIRGLKQILLSTPSDELYGMESASQQVQSALMSITQDWESL